MFGSKRIPLVLAVTMLSIACTAEPKNLGSDLPTTPDDADSLAGAVVVRTPGAPIPGLSARELALFGRGLGVFNTEFTPATGLGPLFNSTSCIACHDDPSPGGYGDSVEVHVSAVQPGGQCDVLEAAGGPVVQQHATPALQALGILIEPTPPGATAIGHRSTPLIFGLGLLDAVPERTIRALARVHYRNGVHGRPALLPDGRIGRFGRKASVASLDEFNAGAFFNEMGVTNTLNPVEGTMAGNPLPAGTDLAPDPELDASSLQAASTFVKLLGPVAPKEVTNETRFGQQVFYQIQCSSCHIPYLFTGASTIPALRFRWFRAYTDLLLHDMGPDLADMCNGVASPSEFRTQPLIGMQFLDMFMHDGASETIDDAIRRHGGEGAASRSAYLGLSPGEQAALITFVQSL
jgi:CxxC motif-containing protein (DUF1111 family)